jgi:hypothetical protein
MKTRRQSMNHAAAAALAVLCVSLAAPASVPTGRYTVSPNALVDTQTHLIWQRASGPSSVTWQTAKDYCASLTLDGATWRLPTFKDLQSILDLTTTTAPNISPLFTGTASAYYWSSTFWAANGGNTSAWAVNFNHGGSLSWGLTFNSLSVRCVR